MILYCKTGETKSESITVVSPEFGMKTKKFVEDLKNMSVAELNAQLVDAKKELFNLRFQNATNQLDNTGRIREVRRNIARIQTVITEAQRNSSN